MVLFDEHRPFSLENAQKTVDKAGFKYLGADVVARGLLQWSGAPDDSDLLLKDSKAEMTLRLTASDTESSYNRLVEEYRRGNLGDTVQVHGTVIESGDALETAEKLGAQFSLAVIDWSQGKSAKLPPLVPEKNDKSQEDSGKDSDDGWF
ncbi:MAG: hypothetical protein ABEK50_07535 [bacterium]